MKLIKELYTRNPILCRLGTAHLLIALLLALYLPFNDTVVLGLNSVVKPIKFALSIAIFSYTMAWLQYYLATKHKVKVYSRVAVIAMVFEQSAITIQALRGEKSHYNSSSFSGMIVFALMGVFILTLVLWTVYITWLFIRQKTFSISAPYVLGIRSGLLFFCVFSLFGSYVASLPGHTVGAADGSAGLPLVNWSNLFGDLRIAHFFGIHSLQLIPAFAFFSHKITTGKKAVLLVWLFSLLYLAFILFTMLEALKGRPFMQ